MEIQLDITQVQRVLTAHQSALMTFCNEFRLARPELAGDAEDTLDGIAKSLGLDTEVFDKAKQALRGEAPVT